ncbi:MAG: hypothetical protein IKI84_06070 [Clostridia bacterium]|nr:hypothetical protein [Clostridia bacterium]
MKKALSMGLALILWAGCAAGETAAAVRYEFEDGELHGNARVMTSGGLGWVEGLANEGDGVTVTVNAPEDGFYDLTVRSASTGGYKENYLLLDGEPIGNTVTEGGTYGEHSVSHIYLTEGEHRVTVSSFWGYVRLDCLTVTPSEALPEDMYDVPPTLCNPSPSAETQALMDWMCDIYGEKMISGQYLDENQYGLELKAVASATDGLFPAMVGLDMLNYSPASVSLGTRPTSVDQAIEYWRKGYILTMCWHWVPPVNYLNTNDNSWWGGFYTRNTTISLEKIMNGEDQEGYDLLVRDMDAIAEQLKRLRDAGVPVLWRPLHEASGGWFWWGASGAEPYIKLYRLMYERYTGVHGLNNLIWVWNGQNAAWYPGDDVVDIIGTDIYAGNHAHDSQSASFLKCRETTAAKKLVMLSECGCVPSPIKCRRDGTMWSAWAVWNSEFVQVGGKYNDAYTSADDLKMFYGQDFVVTLKDVPDFGRSPAESGEGETAGNELTWEFTDAVLTGNARLGGGGVQLWGNDEGDTAALTVSVPSDGDYRLTVVQSGIGGGKENYLFVDGEKIGNTVVQGEEEEACEFGVVPLTAGEHEIRVGAFWGWTTLRSLILAPVEAGGLRVEFEDGELMGNVKIAPRAGEICVELASNDETDGVRVTFMVEEEGDYDLILIQAGIGGYKENYLTLDGERIGNTVVRGTDMEECVTGPVHLAAGEHEVIVTCFWGWTDLDALVILPAAGK